VIVVNANLANVNQNVSVAVAVANIKLNLEDEKGNNQEDEFCRTFRKISRSSWAFI